MRVANYLVYKLSTIKLSTICIFQITRDKIEVYLFEWYMYLKFKESISDRFVYCPTRQTFKIFYRF